MSRFADRIFGSPVPTWGTVSSAGICSQNWGKKQGFGSEIYLADTIPGEKHRVWLPLLCIWLRISPLAYHWPIISLTVSSSRGHGMYPLGFHGYRVKLGFKKWMTGGFKHDWIIFHNIWDNPSHWLSYFSRWLKPPTRWRLNIISIKHTAKRAQTSGLGLKKFEVPSSV